MSDTLYANVWEDLRTGEQFLGLPWKEKRSFCDGAAPLDRPGLRKIGVLHIRGKPLRQRGEGKYAYQDRIRGYASV